MSPVRPLLAAFCLLAGFARAQPAFDPEQYAAVAIAPGKTSIYIGSVTLTTPSLPHRGETYAGTYAAKVFPYFFYNEEGTLSIDVTDDMLRALARGETVDFTGTGLSSDGEPRRIEGKATPADATTGKIKVRIFVSKKIQLIFNTTYRFTR